METRPRLHPNRCLFNKLGSPKGVHLSTVQSDRQNSRESDDRQGRTNSCCPSLAGPTLMASPLKTFTFTTTATPGMLMYDAMVKYIVSLGKNSFLTLKITSIKSVTLFALKCPERISAFATLDLRLCSVHPGVSFRLSTHRKSGSADKPAEVFFARFDQDTKPCPVECFRHYLKLTTSPITLLLNLTRCLSHSYVPCHFYDIGTLDKNLHESSRNRQSNVQGSFYAWCFNDGSRQRACATADYHIFG